MVISVSFWRARRRSELMGIAGGSEPAICEIRQLSENVMPNSRTPVSTSIWKLRDRISTMPPLFKSASLGAIGFRCKGKYVAIRIK